MSTELVTVETGEIVNVGRMTPGQAADWAGWVRELMRSVLVEGQDYGVIPGTGTKPTMYKSGGEMLLRAAGLGFTSDRLDDADARDHQGITYRCTVTRPDGSIAATCDGYCGRDETSKRNANWNSVIKIAQKRAMVGAALNATVSSGLFNADLDDDPPPPQPQPPANDPPVLGDDIGFLTHAMGDLSDAAMHWVDTHGQADSIPQPGERGFRRSHRDRLAWYILVAQRITTPQPDETADYHARVQAMRREKQEHDAAVAGFVPDDQRGQ